MTADDDLRRAWAAYTLRFADPHDPARHSDTTIRDAFVSGWEAALAARSEPRAGLRYRWTEGGMVAHDEGEYLAATPPAEGPDPVECAICADYSAQGVEVHESCLAMLRRAALAPEQPE